MIRFTFDGVDMIKYFVIQSVTRDIGNDIGLSFDDSPLIGVNLQERKIGAKIIKVRMTMLQKSPLEIERMKHELAGLLNTSEPKKMVFSDEPDKYYLGMLNGKINIDRIARWNQSAEIEFVIPDGVAHSTTYRKFDSDEDAKISSDKMIFDLKNSGTVDAFPVVTIKNNSENGYVGMLNTSGMLEIGNKEEMDREPAKPSEFLLDFRNDISSALANGRKNVAVLTDRGLALAGRLQTINKWNKNHIYLAERGGRSGKNGGSLTWDIPRDSYNGQGGLNETLYWQQIFIADHNESGVLNLSVSDENGQFLYGVETQKKIYGLDSEFTLLTSDGKGGAVATRKWNFRSSERGEKNPFKEDGGVLELKRNDDRLTLYWQGSYYEMYVPELRGKKSVKIHLTFGANGIAPLIKYMYVNSLYYRKDFAKHANDIPNRFPIGSNIIINCAEDSVYVDGLKKISDVVDGSVFLKVPPGDSHLEIHFSSWLKSKPKVTVEFEERWL